MGVVNSALLISGNAALSEESLVQIEDDRFVLRRMTEKNAEFSFTHNSYPNRD